MDERGEVVGLAGSGDDHVVPKRNGDVWQIEGMRIFGRLAVVTRLVRKTIYKWLKRYAKDGEEGLRDISRRPHQSPKRCSKNVEAKVLKIRGCSSRLGSTQIGVRLKTIGEIAVPVDSTIHEILRRHERIDPEESAKHTAWQRFEHAAANQLWQMDFKGWFTVGNGVQCHPSDDCG